MAAPRERSRPAASRAHRRGLIGTRAAARGRHGRRHDDLGGASHHEVAPPDSVLVARDWLMHALGRACLALRDPDCAPLLGPPVPGATLPLGARVPGTSLELDPASAAFNLGAMIRGERACPADHVAAALAAADYCGAPRALRRRRTSGRRRPAGCAAPGRSPLPRAGGRGPVPRRSLAVPARRRRLRRHRPARWWCRAAVRRRASREPRRLAGRGRGRHAGPRREQRRAAGENAARALRHALAVLREAPPAGVGADAASGGYDGSRAGAPGAGRVTDTIGASLPSATPAPEHACLGADFAAAVASVYPPTQAAAIVGLFGPGPGLEALAVDAFVARLVRN